ncbi:MAG: PaaI family thioesterase, partial [Pseudomonadota bacterium]
MSAARGDAGGATGEGAVDALRDLERRRDVALERLVAHTPFVGFLGVNMERLGDELTGRLRFDPKLIGSPHLPALHGGGIGAFLEITAQLSLAWGQVWDALEAGGDRAAAIDAG